MKWLKKLFGISDGLVNSDSSDIEKIVEKYETEERKIKKAGSVNGKHYTKYVDHIKLLYDYKQFSV